MSKRPHFSNVPPEYHFSFYSSSPKILYCLVDFLKLYFSNSNSGVWAGLFAGYNGTNKVYIPGETGHKSLKMSVQPSPLRVCVVRNLSNPWFSEEKSLKASIQRIYLRKKVDQKWKIFTWCPNQPQIIDTGASLDRGDEASTSRSPWRNWAFSGCPLSRSVASNLTLAYFYDSVANPLSKKAIQPFNCRTRCLCDSYLLTINHKQQCFQFTWKFHATYFQVDFPWTALHTTHHGNLTLTI